MPDKRGGRKIINTADTDRPCRRRLIREFNLWTRLIAVAARCRRCSGGRRRARCRSGDDRPVCARPACAARCRHVFHYRRLFDFRRRNHSLSLPINVPPLLGGAADGWAVWLADGSAGGGGSAGGRTGGRADERERRRSLIPPVWSCNG